MSDSRQPIADSLWSQALREPNRPQLGSQVLPLPCALGTLVSLAHSVQTDSLRGIGRGVRGVVGQVRDRACLPGRTGSSDSGWRTLFGRVTSGGVGGKCGGSARCNRKFPTFPRAHRCDRCARSVIARTLRLEDRQGTLGAARAPECDCVVDRKLKVGLPRSLLVAHSSIVSAIGPARISPWLVVSTGRART